MALKRFLLVMVGAGAAAFLWLVGHLGGGTPAGNPVTPQNAGVMQTLAAMQSDMAKLQQKNQLAEQNLKKLKAESLTWKNQNQKLLGMLQTARTENLSLMSAVQKWQAAAAQPSIHTVTGASGHHDDGNGGNDFGD